MGDLYKQLTPLNDEEFDEYIADESRKLMSALLTLTQPYDEEVLTVAYSQCFVTTASIFAFKNDVKADDFEEFVLDHIKEILDNAIPIKQLYEALRTGNTTGVVQ